MVTNTVVTPSSLHDSIAIVNNFPINTNDASLHDCIGNIIALLSTGDSQLKLVQDNINYDSLFAILSTQLPAKRSHGDTHQQACCLLRRIFRSLPPNTVLDRCQYRLVESSLSDSEDFQMLCMDELLRASHDAPLLLGNQEVLKFTVMQLGSRFTSVASSSRKSLLNLFQQEASFSWMFTGDISTALTALCSQGPVMYIRVAECLLDLAENQQRYINDVLQHDGLKKILSELQSDDILAQLNCLEILTRLANIGAQGLLFVRENRVMEWILNLLNSDDALASFLIPGAVKFFGNVAQANVITDIPEYAQALRFVIDGLSSSDASLRALCAETIGQISTSGASVKLLHERHISEMKQAYQRIGAMCASGSEDFAVKCRVVDAVGQVFSHDGSDVEISMMCEKVYRNLREHPMKLLFELLQHPFPELKASAYRLLCGVLKYSWAEQDVALSPGFCEYLLDRSTETEKEGRELKHEAVQLLANSATSADNLGVDAQRKFAEFARQGPFYSESRAAVMVEEQD